MHIFSEMISIVLESCDEYEAGMSLVNVLFFSPLKLHYVLRRRTFSFFLNLFVQL